MASRPALQNGTTTLAGVVGQAQPFDLRTRRDVLDLEADLQPDRQHRLERGDPEHEQERQPTLGRHASGSATPSNWPVPIDTRTTELGTAVEWTGRRGLARLGYDGSFFRNNIATLTWDNPLRITDSATAGPLQGRMALWPNSNMNTASATGAINLPARSRATRLRLGGELVAERPAHPVHRSTAPCRRLSLDRPTADVQARVTAMTYAFTSKPLNPLWISVRYRSYDFDNQTPIFRLANTVAYDTSVAAYAHGGTSPYSFTRRTFDADASFTPLSHAAFRAGYTREQLEPDVSVLRHDHRRHGAAVGRPHRSELADAARPLRARPSASARASTNRRSTTSANRSRCGSSISRIATATGCRRSCR